MRRAEWPVFLTLLAIGTFLRIFRLGEESLWGDEYFTLDLASQSIGGIVDATWRDVHPPLYFILIKLWSAVFSPSLVSVRAFSSAISILTIPLFWRLARRWIGAEAALVATALFSLSPFQIWYAQEARMYALLVLLEVAMLLSATAYFESPEGPRRSVNRMFRAAALVALFVCSAAALHTHFYGLFIVAFVLIYWFLELFRPGPHRSLAVVPMVLYGIWLAIAMAPLVIQISGHVQSGARDWVPPLTLGTFHGILNAFAYGVFILPRPAWLILPLGIAYSASLAAAFLPIKIAPFNASIASARLPLILLICALGAPVAISFFRPIVYFGQRYEIIATVPFYMLVGLGLIKFARIRRSPASFACATVLIAIMLIGMVWYHRDYFDSRQKRPFDLAAHYLDLKFNPGDAIVLPRQPYVGGCLKYYLEQPFEFISLDERTIQRAVARNPDRTIWFINFAPAFDPVEVASMAPRERGTTFQPYLIDSPAQILRLTPYRKKQE